jgi:hypothetical protein
MKTLFTLFLLFITSVTYARQWSVSNNPDVPAQFTTISDAIVAASNGDTILVAGSSTQYDFAYISKKLCIIGNAAFDSPGNLKTFIGYIQLSRGVSTAADNSTFIGLECSYLDLLTGVKSIIIERCNIGDITLYGLLFGQPNDNDNNYTGFSIRNSRLNNINPINQAVPTGLAIVNTIICGNLNNISRSLLSNNIFINSLSSSIISNTLFTNNIFYEFSTNPSLSSFNAAGSIFLNNCTYSAFSFSLPTYNSTGSGNLNNTNPRFISQASILATLSTNILNIDHNYGLEAASPLRNAGTDGTDIGITGGQLNYRWSNSPLPNMPMRQAPTPLVTLLKANNGQSYVTTGSVNVQLKAKKRD